MSATIEMECLICKDSIKTSDVNIAIAFDMHHQKTCPPAETKGGE